MAGSNPGMVIKVAADIDAAQKAFTEVSASATAAAQQMTGAFDQASVDSQNDLRDIANATKDVDTAAEDTKYTMLALGAGIGVMAAEAIGALVRLGIDGFEALAGQVWDLIDGAVHLKDRWRDFKDEISAVLEHSGVLEAGIQSLGRSILEAFGTTRQGAIREIARIIENGAIAVLGWAQAFLTMAEWGGRAVGLLMGPLDALTVAVNTVVTGLLDGVVKAREAVAHLPGFGGPEYAAATEQIRQYADSWREVRDRTTETMHAHDDMAKGQGAFIGSIEQGKAAIQAAQQAMREQQAAAAAAAVSVGELGAANTGLVEGTGQAAVALYNENEQLAKFADAEKKFDEYQAKHTKYGVDMLLHLGTFEKKVQDIGQMLQPGSPAIDGLATMTVGVQNVAKHTKATREELDAWMEDEKRRGNWSEDMQAQYDRMAASLEKTTGATRRLKDGTEALDSGLKFSAETIGEEVVPALEEAEAHLLSFSDAMALVSQGKGTMTGTIGQATKPAGMSDMEFQQMQSDPRTWEILHGWDWQSKGGFAGGGTGSTWAWLDWQQPAARAGNTTNIVVNTVAGDKQAIASVVKDALADDWRSQGVKG